MATFREVPTKVDFPAMERDLLEWWKRDGIVEKYLHRNDVSSERFSFLDGPITANNAMGVHHGWGRTYKDLFQRYQAMLGKKQRFQNGFDCQGLWVEVEVEKELGLKSKRDIETFGVAEFVERCKERVRKFSARQTDQSIRLGYWMDWDNSYYTMSDENNYTIWHFLKTCHEKGWIYKGHDVMPWCPRCGTGISEHEIATEGYQDRTHLSVFVHFPLLDEENASLLAWTTTPWTLAANVAAAVHPELDYIRAEQNGRAYYLARDAAKNALRGEYEVTAELKGADLVGRVYTGPFDELPASAGVQHRVIAWNDVSAVEGTGIVHIAPGCGKEDFALSKVNDLQVIAPINEFGVYVPGFDWLSGQYVHEVATPIMKNLQEKGFLYRGEQYKHRYPVCWRCNTDLVFRLVDEWFIRMDELRQPMMDVTRQVNWVPSFGMDRELDWLLHMDDWMISKKRYWGLALPIYECANCGNFEVIGSEVELKARAVEGWDAFEGNTPHRPWVDAVKIACAKCGEKVSRIPDVGNPWLDAGIVAFSTLNYRHDPEYWAEWYPADLITESFPGQFRNWFYAVIAESTALTGKPAFKNVFSYALMRDEKGEEMHKSKGNAIWFEDAAESMGVDTMRWLFSTVNPSTNMNFGFNVADEVRRRFILPLWNSYSFFATYARLDNFDPLDTNNQVPLADRSLLDRWIISRLNQVVAATNENLLAYNPNGAANEIERFVVEELSNWYIRRNRRRFWKSDSDRDKAAAYITLYECLVTVSKLVAPFIPFVAESIYQNLVRAIDQDAPESVHLCLYPIANSVEVDELLSRDMKAVIAVVRTGRAARSRSGYKVRQPLNTAYVYSTLGWVNEAINVHSEQIEEELNVHSVKRIIFSVSDEVKFQRHAAESLEFTADAIIAEAQELREQKVAESRRKSIGSESGGLNQSIDDSLLEPILDSMRHIRALHSQLGQATVPVPDFQSMVAQTASQFEKARLELALVLNPIQQESRRWFELAQRFKRYRAIGETPAHTLGEAVRWDIRPNLPILGPRYGKQLSEIRSLLSSSSANEVAEIVFSGSKHELTLADGTLIQLGVDELLIELVAQTGFAAAQGEFSTVVLDTEITPELIEEGIARDFVRGVQDARKSAGYRIEDRIIVEYTGDPEISGAIDKFADYVRSEILADTLTAITIVGASDQVESEETEGPGGSTDADGNFEDQIEVGQHHVEIKLRRSTI